MEDPIDEISSVVTGLCSSPSPDEQKRLVQTYFVKSASFDHPLCRVLKGPNSRDEQLLKIYQWYRIMSPILKSQVDDVDFDENNLVLYVRVTQTFHIFISPFRPAPSHLLVRLTLVKRDSKFYVTSQTDYYQPEDLAALVFPPLKGLILLQKSIATLLCIFWLAVFQWTFGWWVPKHESETIGAGVWKGLAQGAMDKEKKED